jgi:hypothetical protein
MRPRGVAARKANRNAKIVSSGAGLEEVTGFHDGKSGPRSQAFINAKRPQGPLQTCQSVHRGFKFSRKPPESGTDDDIPDARGARLGILEPVAPVAQGSRLHRQGNLDAVNRGARAIIQIAMDSPAGGDRLEKNPSVQQAGG